MISAQFNQPEKSIETLRPALQRERGSFSNWSTEARPFARSSVGGSEVGAKLKGLDRILKERWNEKGALRPFVCRNRLNCCADV